MIELSKRLPNIRYICQYLDDAEDLDPELIIKIVEKFKLNEEILKLAIPILCKKAFEPLCENLVGLLTFYASAENNENLRLIVLDGLNNLQTGLLKKLPKCIFRLLLDDEEEIRNEICRLLNPSYPLNLAQTLKTFVGSNVVDFIQFLNDYKSSNSPQKSSKLELFEKEPLNLFIDIHYLQLKFAPK